MRSIIDPEQHPRTARAEEHRADQIRKARALGLLHEPNDESFCEGAAITLAAIEMKPDYVALFQDVHRIRSSHCEVRSRIERPPYVVTAAERRYTRRFREALENGSSLPRFPPPRKKKRHYFDDCCHVAIMFRPEITSAEFGEIISELQLIKAKYRIFFEMQAFRRKEDLRAYTHAVTDRSSQMLKHLLQNAKKLISAERASRTHGLHWRQALKVWPYEWHDVSLHEDSGPDDIRHALTTIGCGDRFEELFLAAAASVPPTALLDDVSPFVFRERKPRRKMPASRLESG